MKLDTSQIVPKQIVVSVSSEVLSYTEEYELKSVHLMNLLFRFSEVLITRHNQIREKQVQ